MKRKKVLKPKHIARLQLLEMKHPGELSLAEEAELKKLQGMR